MRNIKGYKRFLEKLESDDFWDIIPNSIKEIHELFKKNGKKLYIVGGSIRDYIIGGAPKDFDLATDANPDEITSIIGRKFRTDLQGEFFGVIRVFTPDQPEGIEIATFRTDEYGDDLGKSRNPKVKFTTIEGDVNRRDLTINGLFYDLESRDIIDLVGGLGDIKSRLVRMIGNPTQRIIEDPLRILRVVRFSFRYGFEIDKKTSDSIIRNVDRLDIITKERIWDEIKKAYSHDSLRFNEYLKILSDLGVLEKTFPGVILNREFPKCDNLEVHLAKLFIDNQTPKLERTMVIDWKIDILTTRKTIFLINFRNMKPTDINEIWKEYIRCHIEDPKVIEFISITPEISKTPHHKKFLDWRPSVSSKELMDLGYSGKDLGNKIKELEIQNFKKFINI
jgi:poly(A) polymerase